MPRAPHSCATKIRAKNKAIRGLSAEVLRLMTERDEHDVRFRSMTKAWLAASDERNDRLADRLTRAEAQLLVTRVLAIRPRVSDDEIAGVVGDHIDRIIAGRASLGIDLPALPSFGDILVAEV